MKSTFDWLHETLVADYKIDARLITLDATLEDIGLDSLAVAELLFAVEDAFKITLSSEPLPMITLADVVAYIDGLVETQHGVKDRSIAEDSVP